jgi:hypothetical protein
VRLRRILFIFALASLGGSALCQTQTADLKDVRLPKLKSHFDFTKMTADGNDVVTAGSAVTLNKDGLQRCSVEAIIPIDNSYKGGKPSECEVRATLCGALRHFSNPLLDAGVHATRYSNGKQVLHTMRD